MKKVLAWRCIGMWSRARHVLGCSWTTTVQQVRAKPACRHGPGWRTVHASSIDEKGLIIKSKATSAPPRAGTTGTVIANYHCGFCSHSFGKLNHTPCSDTPKSFPASVHCISSFLPSYPVKFPLFRITSHHILKWCYLNPHSW